MKLLVLFLSSLMIWGCAPKSEKASEVSSAAVSKISDRGLEVGAQAPEIKTKDVESNVFDLNESLSKGPVVLVFYRGGWCPYCSLQLRKLQLEAFPRIKDAGGELVAVSVDKINQVEKMKEKESLGMIILSDPTAKILKAYDVDYKVPDDLVEKYIKKYKIDLEAHSGEKHHIIAVPAVYVINKSGKVTFSYVNEDYKVRAQVEDIVKAVEAL
jgi:peroxiredoxin